MDKIYTSEELAERYHMSPRGIAGWRYQGTGPRWFVAGKRALYREADLLAWEAEQFEDRPATA